MFSYSFTKAEIKEKRESAGLGVKRAVRALIKETLEADLKLLKEHWAAKLVEGEEYEITV